MKKLIVLGFSFLLMLAYTSCQYIDIVPNDGSDIEVSDDLSFAVDIEPIFKAQSCTNCHPGMHQPSLTEGNSYASLTDGSYVNEKKPEESEIVIVPGPESSHAAKLTAEQVQLIKAWIEQGAKDN